MKLVTALVPKHSKHAIWTGLNEHDKEDDWKWSDSSPYEYSLWDRGQPDDNGGIDEDCMMINHGGRIEWHDMPCDRKLSYICKRIVDKPVCNAPKILKFGFCIDVQNIIIPHKPQKCQ